MLFKHTTLVPHTAPTTREHTPGSSPPPPETTGFPALLPGEGDEGVLWGRLLALWAPPLGISRLASQIHMDYWRNCYATTPCVHFSGWFAHPDERQCYSACTGTDYPATLQPGEQCGTA